MADWTDWTGPWPWVAAGALLLLAAIAWRWTHRRRTATRLAEALRADDPARRRAAVAVAAEQGLRQCGALLLERSAVEQDPDVVDALVGAVLRNAWEPADRPEILTLRLWAHQRRAGATPSGSAGAWTEPPVTAPVARVRSAEPPPAPPRPTAWFSIPPARHRSPHLPRHRAASIRFSPAPTPAAQIPTAQIPTAQIPTAPVPTALTPAAPTPMRGLR